MKVINTINVTCKTADTLPFEELTEFQGGLKKREDTDIDKIVHSIKKHGFAFPFFVWKKDGINYLIDGHGRYKALEKLDSLGFMLPQLPVVYVDCKNEQGARELLLRLNSHYGKMTAESVTEFINGFEIDLSEMQLPDGILSFNTNEEDFKFDDIEAVTKENKLHEIICPDCGRRIVLDSNFKVVDKE